MATNILSPRRTQYISVKKFMELCDLPKSTAYRLVHEKDFPKVRLGKRTIRIPLEPAMEYIEKKYN